MPNNTDFLEKLGIQKNLITGWEPFKQSKYISEILHGGLPSDSPWSDGVCIALCYYVIRQWIDKGPNNVQIGLRDDLDNGGRYDVSAAEQIQTYMENDAAGNSYNYFNNSMRQAGYRKCREAFVTGYKQVIEDSIIPENTFNLMALGGLARGGHAILCSGYPNFCIFDPNVGYLSTDNQENYTWAFLSLFQTYNSEYTQPGSGIRIIGYQ